MTDQAPINVSAVNFLENTRCLLIFEVKDRSIVTHIVNLEKTIWNIRRIYKGQKDSTNQERQPNSCHFNLERPKKVWHQP